MSKRKRSDDPVDKIILKNVSKKGKLFVANDVIDSLLPQVYSKNIFIGTKKYNIKDSLTPLEQHTKYITYVFNDIQGYISNYNINSIEQIVQNLIKLLTQMFFTILSFNKILFYSNINIYTVTSNTILGEPMIYIIDNRYNKIDLYININEVKALINNTNTYSINFSDSIINFNCLSNDSFLHNKTTMESDIQKLLLRLYTIADHTATHYMESYLHSKTDWIGHNEFGKDCKTYITSHILFNITSNIENNINQPTIISINGKTNEDMKFDYINKFINTTNINSINSINQVQFSDFINPSF